MDKFKVLTGKGYDWETFVYIFQDIEGCKFGITNNIERRQRQYEKNRPSLKLKYCKPFRDRNIARYIEYLMKVKFPIINGLETTSASALELISFIETIDHNLDVSYLVSLPTLDYIEIKETIVFDENERTESLKSYSIANKRLENTNAYMKWTKDDDEKLEQLFCEGKSIKELCEIFGRNNGAIKSRINKLELYQKNSRQQRF
ncbi:hypothetical protein [Flavobacterium sp. CAU 1735]|uniref:hypothetical protein n=1 Tax=Flavobacterium sp. CAU 1735 TaxID=3140361 RepID=UPI0032609DF8